jgi:hypothetical protein
VLRIISVGYDDKAEGFFDWCEGFSERENVKFTFTVSADIAQATDSVKKYF